MRNVVRNVWRKLPRDTTPFAIMLMAAGGMALITGTLVSSVAWVFGIIYGFSWRSWIARSHYDE